MTAVGNCMHDDQNFVPARLQAFRTVGMDTAAGGTPHTPCTSYPRNESPTENKHVDRTNVPPTYVSRVAGGHMSAATRFRAYLSVTLMVFAAWPDGVCYRTHNDSVHVNIDAKALATA
jgi:hypothetical protein